MTTKKVCTNCWKEKSLDEFHIQSSHKDWHRSECKLCRRYKYWMDKQKKKFTTEVVEVQAPTPRVNVWEWIKRLFA